MDSMLARVKEFHEKFGVPVAVAPQVLDEEASTFRIKFLKEELEEYEIATEHGDIAKQFDALLDMLYVLLGTMLWHGFPVEDGFTLVHAANMAKVRVDHPLNSTRNSRFDVVKPEGWQSPDEKLHALLMFRMFNQLAPTQTDKVDAARERIIGMIPMLQEDSQIRADLCLAFGVRDPLDGEAEYLSDGAR